MNGWLIEAAGLAFVLLGLGSTADAATFKLGPPVVGGGVKGMIVTDGTAGVIKTAHILDRTLVRNDGTNVLNLIGDGSAGGNSAALIIGAEVRASAKALTSNFNSFGIAMVQSPVMRSSQLFLCFGGRSCFRTPNTVSFHTTRDLPPDMVATPQSGPVGVATAAPLPATSPLAGAALVGFGALVHRKRHA